MTGRACPQKQKYSNITSTPIPHRKLSSINKIWQQPYQMYKMNSYYI